MLIELDPLLELLQALGSRCACSASCALVVAHVLVATHDGGHGQLSRSLSFALPVHCFQVVVVTLEALLALDQQICAPVASGKRWHTASGHRQPFTETSSVWVRTSRPTHVPIGDASRKVAVAPDVV